MTLKHPILIWLNLISIHHNDNSFIEFVLNLCVMVYKLELSIKHT